MSRTRIITVLLAISTALALAAVAANGQSDFDSEAIRDRPSSGKVATLQQQLEKGLKVRFPSEFEYVEHIAKLVQAKRLPLKLVQGSFDYARKKGHPRYPFQYFKRVLELRANRLGIEI